MECPLTAQTPWLYLRRMLESTDPEEWILLNDYEATSWRPTFCRSGTAAHSPQGQMLKRIFRFIAGKNKRGEKGDVYIHLVRRLKKVSN